MTRPPRVGQPRHSVTVEYGGGWRSYTCGCGEQFETRDMWDRHLQTLAERADVLTARVRSEIAEHERRADLYERKSRSWWALLTRACWQYWEWESIERDAAERLRSLIGEESES